MVQYVHITLYLHLPKSAILQLPGENPEKSLSVGIFDPITEVLHRLHRHSLWNTGLQC